MGFKEIMIASETQLKEELGIKELGIRLSLKEYCSSQNKSTTDVHDERELKKQKLISELMESKRNNRNSSSKVKKAESKKTEKKAATHNVQMGWIHNDVRVGLEKGGGTREMKASVDYTCHELIDAGRKWFFPDGRSSFGTADNMKFGLADFKRQPLTKCDGDAEITLGAYAQKNGFKSRVRLYMTSDSRVEEVATSSSDEDPVSWEDPHTSTPLVTSNSVTDSSLKGTSQERFRLKDEQDKAYRESLAMDIKKRDDRVREQLLETDEMEKIMRQEQLRSTRANRVPPEPNIEEDHVVVLVRHITRGVVSRMFFKNATLAQVYDWVGSIQIVPEYFRLTTPISGKLLLPENPITEAAKCVLNMCETEDALSLVHDDSEINAIGYAQTVFGDNISEHFPDNFMEEDEEDNAGTKVSVIISAHQLSQVLLYSIKGFRKGLKCANFAL